MRPYKILTCILFILSVFSVVLAAPVAVQEVREASADVVDEGDNVIIGSGKRAEVQEEEEHLLAAQQELSSSPDQQSTLSQYHGSSSAPNYAGVTDPSPSFSSGECKPASLSTVHVTGLSWNNPEGEAKLIQPETSTEIPQPTSSKAKSVSFAPSREVILPSNEIKSEMLPPDIKPPSSNKGYRVSFAPWMDMIKPSGETYSVMLPPDRKSLPRPLFLDVYMAKKAAQPKKSKYKNIVSKLLGKIKFWRRISGTAGGVVTEGQRDLQGTVVVDT